MKKDSCRFCGNELRSVMSLGSSPVANNLCKTQEEALAAPTFPLELVRCTARDCGLYQLSVAVDAETLYGDYTYATPNNPELTSHYERAVHWIEEHQAAADQFFTVEIGSNNGAFLAAIETEHATEHSLGIDPCDVHHRDAEIPRIFRPFNKETAVRILANDFDTPIPLRCHANLIVARHCLAHIDDVHDVLAGVAHLLEENGLFYIENAYFIDSMLGAQFDQIYHEHMSYLTIEAVQRLLREHEMQLVDVNFSDVHGGSFMLLAAHETSTHQPTVNVPVAIRAERAWLAQGLERRFIDESIRGTATTRALVEQEVAQGHVVDAYGAAAKAVTRFAAAKITHEHVRQCIDDSPIKQGKFLPGSGIPIVSRVSAWGHEPVGVRGPADAPDAVLLTAWNYERSFREREKAYLDAGGRFITP